MTIVLLIAIMAGLPTRRDFRWIAKRSQETSDWVAAVQRLDGRVAVSHHLLLARGAGAECFFSDLILEFRGLRVPADIQRRIAQEQFDYIVLCNDPRTSATTGWAELIEMHYEPAGQLNYADVSAVLPNRVYRKKSGLAAARYLVRPGERGGRQVHALLFNRRSAGARSAGARSAVGMGNMTDSVSCRLR
jgi:hypothetical protein